MVTCLVFSATVRLLFSGSVDNTIGIWTEKGVNLQVRGGGGGGRQPAGGCVWGGHMHTGEGGGRAVLHSHACRHVNALSHAHPSPPTHTHTTTTTIRTLARSAPLVPSPRCPPLPPHHNLFRHLPPDRRFGPTP